jgi:pyruvate formate lyase activating enzyme
MVTNGFINSKPLEELLPYVDAFNIDLKSFRDSFYKDRSAARLNPVLDTIIRVSDSDAHMELTFLLIPGQNDTEKEWKALIRWITENCGSSTVLHVSKYFPRFKLRSAPTPTESIKRFISMARDHIEFVYPGNTPEISNDTICPGCGSLLIERNIYKTQIHGLDPNGSCGNCGRSIYGVFNSLS